LGRSRIDHIYHDPGISGQRLFLHYSDLDDPASLRRILAKIAPDELYHLAGQSHVGISFEIPECACELTAMGTLRLLEIIRDLRKPPRVFHASSSEIFGRPTDSPQDEQTPIAPVTPYGCAKAFATQMVKIYREAYGLFVCSGIMYNHESPRRGENFVIRKICRAAAAIKLGLDKELRLGNTGAARDWGDARDYVDGMWRTLQYSSPEDFVFATGRIHRLQSVIERAFGTVGLNWQQYVKVDSRFLRPIEPSSLVGNPAKAKRMLGWEPQLDFLELIGEMTETELESLKIQKSARGVTQYVSTLDPNDLGSCFFRPIPNPEYEPTGP
jgi:GDPmannose 4,6-dehydratase